MKLIKNYRLSNTFWLYQHRVKYAPFLCYSHLKLQNFKWNTLYLDNSSLRHWDCRWCICIVRVGPSQAWCGMSSAWAPLELSLLLFGLLVTILTWFGSALIQTEFRRLFDHSTPNGLIIFLVIVFRALKDNIRITETDCWRPETLCFKQNNFWKLCYSF